MSMTNEEIVEELYNDWLVKEFGAINVGESDKERLREVLTAKDTECERRVREEREKTIEDVKHLLREELGRIDIEHGDGSKSRVYLDSQLKYLDTLTPTNTDKQ